MPPLFAQQHLSSPLMGVGGYVLSELSCSPSELGTHILSFNVKFAVLKMLVCQILARWLWSNALLDSADWVYLFSRIYLFSQMISLFSLLHINQDDLQNNS